LYGTVALAAAGLCRDAAAQAADAASRARPEPGDRLVIAGAEDDRRPITQDDLTVGGPQLLAWAMQPGTGTVRSASRLNQVLLIRLDPKDLDPATLQRSANGIVAYSAVCTHQQCPVTEWKQEKAALHCACHGSEFDARNGAKVVGGPAPRPLAALPVRLEDGVVVVGGRFLGRVGAPQAG